MSEDQNIDFYTGAYNDVFDKYGICRIYQYKQKMRITYFCGPKWCRYVSWESNAEPMEAFNNLFAIYEAYVNLTEDRQAKLYEDPKFQYITHESNIVLAKRYKLDAIENPVERKRLERLIAEMRRTLQLPTDITDDEYDLVLGLRNQVVSEMNRLAEKGADKIVGTGQLNKDSANIYEIQEQLRKESLKKPLKVGI